MNERLSEMDKELRDTPRVNLVIAIFTNKGKRNACLFLGIIALAVILLGGWEFGWSKWLLLLPAALGIGSFLFQMNILIISSELKRRSEEPEKEKLTPAEREELQEKMDEAKRRLAFMESHKEIIHARLQEYLDENPDDDEIPDEVVELITEKCFLGHEIAEMDAKIEAGPTPTEVERRLAFMKNHKEIIQARLQKYLDENPDVDDLPDEVRRQIIEECFLEHQYRIVFGCTVAFWAGIAGAIVGVLWALALSLSLIFGAILGACINAVFWVLACSAATARGRITFKEASAVMGGCMPMLCGLLTIAALVVWVIRLLL